LNSQTSNAALYWAMKLLNHQSSFLSWNAVIKLIFEKKPGFRMSFLIGVV